MKIVARQPDTSSIELSRERKKKKKKKKKQKKWLRTD